MTQEHEAADDPSKPESLAGGVGVDAETLRRETELRAYYRYCERGCGPGCELDDWLAAEREVLAMHGTPARSVIATSADDRPRQKRYRRQGVARR